jgi:hypothetical protein
MMESRVTVCDVAQPFNVLTPSPQDMPKRTNGGDAEQQRWRHSWLTSRVKEVHSRLTYFSMKFAFDFAEQMYLPHTFNDGNKSCHFMSRNPPICLRNAESTSLMTTRYITHLMIFFFSKREELTEILSHRPSDSMHTKRKCYVSTLTARSSVWTIKSQLWNGHQKRRGRNVKAFCINATGHFIPPIIFSPEMGLLMSYMFVNKTGK